uniref:DUF6817 domain-containing protein n=1 Tax=Trieres chinensis TaxID=1514140 RepID=A0A7S1ZA04_TRICV|mmetsp:Transcript_20916/g.42203  ORF Transcript_20916/g.42203 Transcript_20916/m.42203 type:complete len:312 (+) Transcript_20916:74-1009(+)
MLFLTTATALRATPFLLLALPSASALASENATVASKYKAPNESTPPIVARQWAQDDKDLWSYVEEKVPAVLDHTGSSSFDEHLRGVQAVLRGWGSPNYLTKAGLFHSIYGTEGFQGFSLPLSEREAVQDLIGEKAERLCWIFCMVDRTTVDESALRWTPGSCDSNCRFTFLSRPELGRFEIVVDKEEWLDFLELTLADWLEQVEGAASKPSSLFLWDEGEAYAYRRKAYRAMSRVLAHERMGRLGGIVQQMHGEVYETESEVTKILVQPRTPPMSEAAARALDALRSAGEDIPTNLRPRPEEKMAFETERS